MKIDTTKIAGFEEMTPEDKVAALQSYEFDEPEDNSAELKKLKDLNSKYSSEIAEYKKQSKAKMSEDEKIKSETEELIKNLTEQNEALNNEIKATRFTAKFLSQGYDEDLAKASANALIEGDSETFFANAEKFNDLLRKKIEADVLKTMAPPEDKGKKPSSEMKKADFLKLSPADRLKYSQEHPEEYRKLYGGN